MAQGESLDTKRTFICTKCKTEDAESYKFCMECADRTPKRSIEEVASGSAESLAHKRKEEEKDNHSKRKAKEAYRKKRWKGE